MASAGPFAKSSGDLKTTLSDALGQAPELSGDPSGIVATSADAPEGLAHSGSDPTSDERSQQVIRGNDYLKRPSTLTPSFPLRVSPVCLRMTSVLSF